jgi:DNA-binding transcriptional ArsR family regulator
VLRVQFSAEDLLRTRFATAPAPLLELALGLATLQRGEATFDGWRRQVDAQLPRSARRLLQLVPPSGAGPMFLDPISDGIDDGLDAVRAMPMGFVRRELRRICAAGRPITPWIRALYEGDRAAWDLLADAVRAGHRAVIAPSWARVWKSFRAEIAWRGRMIAEQGMQASLETLYPGSRWQDSTLLIDVDATFTVRPGGHGVTLLPSALWNGRPMISRHPDGTALIVYAALTPLPLVDESPTQDPLADLLGRTRAAVLSMTVDGRTTTELARDLGISAASASEHARTLRRAGLLVTERAGKAVRHTRTSLGDRLLLAECGWLEPVPEPRRPPSAVAGGQL